MEVQPFSESECPKATRCILAIVELTEFLNHADQVSGHVTSETEREELRAKTLDGLRAHYRELKPLEATACPTCPIGEFVEQITDPVING